MPRLTPDAIPAGQMAAMAQPVLKTDDGLLLRPWEPGDAPVLVETYADPDIQRWHCMTVDDLAEAGKIIERWAGGWRAETHAAWAVTDGERVLGRVALRAMDRETGSAEVAYWTTPAGRGRGVAPSAVRAMTAWAFAFGFHRLFLIHSTGNEPSCRAAEKAGYALEGTMRSALLHLDGWHDMHLHATTAG